MIFWMQVQITRAWCWLSGADAVYVKDLDNQTISVKVMRTKFDPFVDDPQKMIRIRRYGFKGCRSNGTVGGGAWLWRYVSQELHVHHKLSE